MNLNLKNIITIFLIVLGSLFITGNVSKSSLSIGGQSQNSAGRFSNIGDNGISSSTLVTTSSATLIATSSAREYAEITNLAGFAIYCNTDAGKPAVLYKGITILASSTKVFGADFSYTGAITCIAPANASTTVYAKQ